MVAWPGSGIWQQHGRRQRQAVLGSEFNSGYHLQLPRDPMYRRTVTSRRFTTHSHFTNSLWLAGYYLVHVRLHEILVSLGNQLVGRNPFTEEIKLSTQITRTTGK